MKLISAIAILTVAAPIHGARAACSVLTDTEVIIQDFQSNVFDLAFASSVDLTPVQTLNNIYGDPPTSQSWFIVAYQATGLYFIRNTDSGTYLSYTGAVTGMNPTGAQLCGHSAQFLWNITANGNSDGCNIIEPSTGLVATSYDIINSAAIGSTTPVTLQNFDGKVTQQVFTFEQIGIRN
ncbi:hypothetical protein GGX14DRAFT_458369 [Mycena pura]|uniref:Ricin B lectin domain-containing protein n=1 Tax=Mycena pura TaxID=153505 RepID=A0AAD6Y8P7_9AGAR|nr:hypothetical protein GGX14DRAFT_458369 [Mycena pura]